MKLGVLILCRYNSTRLPGKILKPIQGKPILQYLHEKINLVVARDQIIICTSTESSDDPIIDFCRREKYNFFRGSLNNVAKRFLDCGQHYQFDFIVRINGDNLFLDPFLLKGMISETMKNEFDFVTNVWKRTYPKGMSIEIVRTKYYANMFNQYFTNKNHFEHVTIYFYEYFDELKSVKCFYNRSIPEAAGIQLAIDTQYDFDLAENIITKFEKPHTEYSFEEIFHLWEKING